MIDISRNSALFGGAILHVGDTTFNLTEGGVMTAIGNNSSMGLGGFIVAMTGEGADINVNFNIGAGAVATIGDANTIADNIANGTDSITGNSVGEGSVGLVKNGDGTLILNQNNVYKGDTELNGGKTIVNGVLYGDVMDGALDTANTGTTNVKTGATLAGSGTVNGLVEVKSGGTFTPGREDGSVAALTLNALSLETGSVMEIFFGSQVIVSDNTPDGLLNAVTIDGGSMLKMLGADLLVKDATYTLISNQSGLDIDGIFGVGNITLDGMALTLISGDTYAFSGPLYSGTLMIDYFGGTNKQDLVVTVINIEVIPEPGAWALMLGGVGVLGYLQRARRNRR